jgi:hypothetical protein
VTIKDSFQYLNVKNHNDIIEVINNKPTPPNVTITPIEPKTIDDLVVIANNSTDIEISSKKIKYWYRWFKNESYLPTWENNTFIPNTATSKGETWRCVVYPFDSDDVGLPSEAEVMIQNSVPELAAPFSYLEMNEDIPMILEDKLLEIFIDPDYDQLTFTAGGQNHIEVEIIQNNGTIILTPERNWYGTEIITFFANDTSPTEAEQTVSIIVNPTNDLPRIVQIGDHLITAGDLDIGFVVDQEDWLNLTIEVEDIDGDADRGMIQYFINKTEQSNLYLLTNESKLIFHPGNSDVGRHYLNISITDNNGTALEHVSQPIWVNVENINDPPTVKIVAPESNIEFLETDDITFVCEADDPDLLIPTAGEKFIYQWYTNKTDTEPLGSGEQITVTNYTLPPGYYTIIVRVMDTGGKKAYDSIKIVIQEVPKTQEKKEGDSYIWIIVLIVIIIILILLFLILFKKKRSKPEPISELKEDEPILKPEDAYKIKVSMAALAQATEATQGGQLTQSSLYQSQAMQPLQAIDSASMTTGATQEVLPSGEDSLTFSQPTPQLPPVGSEDAEI